MKNIIIGTALSNGTNDEIIIAAFYRTGMFVEEVFSINYTIKVNDVNKYLKLFNQSVKYEVFSNGAYHLGLI